MAHEIDDSEEIGQVHPDQHKIRFCPEPGDIIVRKVVKRPDFAEHPTNCILATYNIVELYKDNYYAYPDRCPDSAKRAAYHRLFFRNGDHIIRRGRFRREHNFEYRDEEIIAVWVYWPGFQFHSSFVRLNSTCLNEHGARFFEPQLSQHRCRAQTYRFEENEISWEPGDLILRYFEPGPPGTPNPGWDRLLGLQQVDEESNVSYCSKGDLLIKCKGRPERPANPENAVNVNTRMEIYCYVLTTDVDYVEIDGQPRPRRVVRWMYLCGDSMLFDFNDWDSVLRLPTVEYVPQPADIMISLNEEFTTFDVDTQIGGYVKFYQNAATSVDPTSAVTATGAPTSAAAGSNLPRSERQPPWLEPRWDQLPVPVPEAAHPIVFRFGRWAEESTPHTEPIYRWIWNPHVEMYQRHQRGVDGRTFFQADRTGVNYGEGRDHPAWEEFLADDLLLHHWGAMSEYPLLQGDCIIRRDLRHNVHPLLTHSLLPATNTDGNLRCCPGDLLVRYGLIKEDEGQRAEVAAGGNRYHFGVELYVLVLNRQRIPMWQFRGRDQVIFGSIPKPKQQGKRKLPTDQSRLMGMHNGSMYYYDAPASKTLRTWQLAVAGGPGGIRAKEAALKAREEMKQRKRKEEEGWAKKTQDPQLKPNEAMKSNKNAPGPAEKKASLVNKQDSRAQGESSPTNKDSNKENRSANNTPTNIKVIEATRIKLRHEVLFPTFPSHETGNYRHDFQGHL